MSSGTRRRRLRRRSVVVFLRGKKRKKNSVSLSFWGDRRICVSASFFLPFSFLCTRSLAVTYPRSLSSLSLSDYHRSKSTRSLSKRWCVLFSMIRFCFFLLSRALDFVRICLSKVYVQARERFLSIARVSWIIGRTFSLFFLSPSLSFSRAHGKLTRYFPLSLSLCSRFRYI